ncbi:hypothetical protein BX600DRAFT_515543 [Xylariales sp. PMI_506]|nr:hypothetical protein BX600DRAFT_515543 [Xylariales sp. PMI_506]
MATTDASSASAEARAQGNEFYKKGRLLDAEKAYKRAAALAPDDPLPLSNLSAVGFEKGHYLSSIGYAKKAIDLSKSEADDGAKKQKLLSRLANIVWPHSGEGEEEEDGDDVNFHRRRIIDRLARYRPYLDDVAEFFPIGHDDAQSLFDHRLASSLGPKDDVALLFCGSGDARNVLQTIYGIAFEELMSRKKVCNKIHITVVDHNPAVLARMLVVFDIMVRYGIMKGMKTPHSEDGLIILAYIYSCQFIPPFVAEKLQQHIRTLIQGVEEGSHMLPFLHLSAEARPQIVHVLKQWAQPLGEPFSVHNVRACVKPVHDKTTKAAAQHFGIEQPSWVTSIDSKSFDELMVLLPPDDFVKRREPALQPLAAVYKGAGRGKHKALRDYIDANWKVNITLFDLDFLSLQPGRDRFTQLEFSPFDVIEGFSEARLKDSGSAIDQMGEPFDYFVIGTLNLGDRLVIEAVVGEMTDFMDRARHNGLNHRNNTSSKTKEHDPAKFPVKYDRIHMSNIPDYIGGHLTTFAYAWPLLREDRASSLTFKNLLNPPMFATHAHFQSEYLLMDDDRQIADHFGLTRVKSTGTNKPPIPGYTAFMQENYMEWQRAPKPAIALNRRLSRVAFETWMYSHLLKICLPYPRPMFSGKPIHAPLNLMSFFRLLQDMHEVGYPAHWISAILASTCSGAITTPARAPRTLVAPPKSMAKEVAPSREMRLDAWRAEITTLLSIWCRILPFGIQLESKALVPLTSIWECTTAFPSFSTPNGNLPHFMMVFWSPEIGGSKEP